jgi:glycosyltransferase involved in cell wall biosynthesis
MSAPQRRIAIVTDAWDPQVNGVVTTLGRTAACLRNDGHEVSIVSPALFRSVPCPTYPEIRLSVGAGPVMDRILERIDPEIVHVATEGPLGFAARACLLRRGLRFSTSYHTRFPQYLRARAPIPLQWSYAALRWFHRAAARVMVNTPSMRRELRQRGFRNLVVWGRGVDCGLFRPRDAAVLDLPRPIFAYAGRVAVEKNLDAFLSLDLPGSKLVIGGGPDAAMLQKRYPRAHFVGYRFGPDLAAHIASADVFVFPSRTDTFGLVLLEAMACGVPVAAFPVAGPRDVVHHGRTGVLDEDLRAAALAALRLDPAHCREAALARSWERATAEFARHLVIARSGDRLQAAAS